MTSGLTTKLLSTLRQLFAVQAASAASQYTLDGGEPDARAMRQQMVDAVKPLLLELYQRGMVEAAVRVAALKKGEYALDSEKGEKSLTICGKRTVVCKTKAKKPEPGVLSKPRDIAASLGLAESIEFAFDLFNPKVLDAVDDLALSLCKETLDTATTDVKSAIMELRKLLKAGLLENEANAALAVKVREVFADPYRAFRIASTESSRAVHAGGAAAAKEAGITHHSWLASADACEDCLKLNGKTVEIGKPFIVLPKGGPYAKVLYPPLHPGCFLHSC